MTATPLNGLHQASRTEDRTCSMQNHGSGYDLDVIAVKIDHREFKKPQQLLQLRHPIKIQLCSRLIFCDYSMLVMSNGMGKVSFQLIGTNGFNVKAEN